MSTETPSKDESLVVAGAGVSGLYAAWRLVSDGHPADRIRIIEYSDRVGGRLWSDQMRSDDALPAELGGMFFNTNQPLVYGLCTDVFKLDKARVTPEPDFAWLRSTRLTIEEFADPKILPYKLKPDEQGLSYIGLLMLAIDRIAPGLKDHWPANPKGSHQESLEYLQTLEFEGRLLADWGFWNLLARVISNEAWLALRDVVSTFTLFSNWNGFDAVVSLTLEQAGKWYRLIHGYQKLPEAMAAALAEAGVQVEFGRALTRVSKDEHGKLLLDVSGSDQEATISADRLILAMPQAPIQTILDASESLASSRLPPLLQSIESVPACKIFLTFDKPWWRDVPDGPGKIKDETYGVSHTDLPMRMCYYIGVDEESGRALMLASYGDGSAVDFWRALEPDSGLGRRLRSPLGPRARREIGRQLSEMHGVTVPDPVDGVFINWSEAPFGGAWHYWLPGYRSWKVAREILHPDPDWPIHICGEAWSEDQGWTEGALRTTEEMLQTVFSLEVPDFFRLPDDHQAKGMNICLRIPRSS
ncbi:MAG: NAD(P)/FAD-dependent oxidoreductase [Pseudomonadota bacterium]